jgi:putative aminopeptidase FrvX
VSSKSSREQWLLALTYLPSIAGTEDAVIAWVRTWVARRSDLRMRTDDSGNLVITQKRRSKRRPVYVTAHLDHPGFVVTEQVDAQNVEWQFLGGVADAYFTDARLEFFPNSSAPVAATVTSMESDGRHRSGTARVARSLDPGTIGRWYFSERSLGIRSDRLRAPGCDDLAGVAAALSALDEMRQRPGLNHVGVLLTRAEEMGFIGAIGACKEGYLSPETQLLCIEMSRSFADSPIGAGPIVRVGDASSVFDRAMTNHLSSVAKDLPGLFAWQRKLMVGGSCEATAFGAYGYQSTCLCLPLDNYHNMADIDEVAAGTSPAKVAPEEISLRDFHGLVRLLVASARTIGNASDELSLDDHFESWHHLLA